ncbi:hypothetical protein [Puia sp.]|jgi:hypothetical protein|uniref:hypothetical protein n=1 Tax=Puia sp. TaxID=2045100 RepID=UPI002F4274A3
MKQRKSDSLWKVVMEDVFPDLLRFIFPDADEVYNMERGFEFLDKELAELHPHPDEEKDSRFADKLVKVYHRDATEEWVLLHIEVQGDSDGREAFAERMFTYFYRIRDRYHKPVSAIAIFTGRDGKKMPKLYSYEYRHTRLIYEYSAISILDYSDEELAASNNPFAQIIAAAKLRLMEGKVLETELMSTKLLLAKKLQSKGFEAKKIRAVFNFLRNYVLFDSAEMNCKFDSLSKQTNKTPIMNTDEWLKMEGREEATESIVENLLKGTDFTIEKIASLTNATVEFVNEISDNLKR